MRHVCWFSCGAASAVAAKLAVDAYDAEVVYCNTMRTEHSDNLRFFYDIEKWIGKPITTISSEKYNTVDEVFMRTHYMSGIAGARCTTEMKKVPREAYQRMGDVHIFGYTADEKKRAADFEERNQDLAVEWILIDRKITKKGCLHTLEGMGIKLPEMYEHGFEHNNCLGCVKSQSAGYWNRTRRLFPQVFKRRAEQSRLLGVRLVVVQGVRLFLDELPLDADAPDDDIECGPVCQQPERK